MIKKIINKNLPDIGKAGQYNFDKMIITIFIVLILIGISA